MDEEEEECDLNNLYIGQMPLIGKSPEIFEQLIDFCRMKAGGR